MSRAGCSCRWLQRHHFDSISFISRLLGAANHGFPGVIFRNAVPANLTIGDFSLMWIASGLTKVRQELEPNASQENSAIRVDSMF